MSSPVFLHIGMPKTGTSSIQAYLHQNRKALRERGLVVPHAPGRKNHSKITLYAHTYRKGVTILQAHEVASQSAAEKFRESFLTEMKQEASLWRANETVVLTGEHMSLLREPEEFDRLKKLLAVMGERPVKIVVYLRRQDLFYLSGYSQRIKNGSTLPWSDLGEHFDPATFNYAAMLEGWKSAFGKDAIIVRVFERGQMIGGDLLKDFMSVIGFADVPIVETVRKNESLDARTLEFLRRLNPWYPRFVQGRLNKDRRALVSAMEQLSEGPSLRMGRTAAVEFLTQYEDCNRTVAQEYLGRADGKLFLDDPKDESEAPPSLTLDDAMELSAKLWAMANTVKQPARAADLPDQEVPPVPEAKRRRTDRTRDWNWF